MLDVDHPIWDLAASCTVRDRPGLPLMEAKGPLRRTRLRRNTGPTHGQRLEEPPNGTGAAITEANDGLRLATGRPWAWAISRDSHYQLSNRFAWGVEAGLARHSRGAVVLGIPERSRDDGSQTTV